MTHTEFSPYHNRHIRFIYADPDNGIAVVLTGVVVDMIKYSEKKTPTEYVYIGSNDLIEWQQAHESGNNVKEYQLQRVIDIRYIMSATLI